MPTRASRAKLCSCGPALLRRRQQTRRRQSSSHQRGPSLAHETPAALLASETAHSPPFRVDDVLKECLCSETNRSVFTFKLCVSCRICSANTDDDVEQLPLDSSDHVSLAEMTPPTWSRGLSQVSAYEGKLDPGRCGHVPAAVRGSS